MNTRFSPSLNGSLHLGHLYMAWVNRMFAHMHGGSFTLRFDDIAPRVAGEDVTLMPRWASDAEALLQEAGLAPDRVSYLSAYSDPDEDYCRTVGGKNLWVRASNVEGHVNLMCSPLLVKARVNADIAEQIGVIIRGEELVAELQLYEYFNAELGGPARELVFLPRLRVRCGGEVTTISKTHGNLQLRDLFRECTPKEWLERLLPVVLRDPGLPLSWDNIHPDPIISVE